MPRVRCTPRNGQLGVGHRVDQAAHQVGRAGRQLVVLAAERDDAHRRPVAEQPGHPVGVQPGAADHHVGRQVAAGRLEHDLARAVGATDDLGARPQPGTGVAQPPHEHGAHRAVVDDAGLRHVQCGDRRDVRLVLAGLRGGEPGDGQPVGQTALLQGGQAVELAGGGRHDQLPGDPVRHPLVAGQREQGRRARTAPERLAAARRVVQARVHHPAVAAGLVARPVVLLLDHRHLRRRVVAQHPLGHGEPHDAAADHDDAPARRHGIRRTAQRAWWAARMRAYSRPESLTVRTWVS